MVKYLNIACHATFEAVERELYSRELKKRGVRI